MSKADDLRDLRDMLRRLDTDSRHLPTQVGPCGSYFGWFNNVPYPFGWSFNDGERVVAKGGPCKSASESKQHLLAAVEESLMNEPDDSRVGPAEVD